MPEFAHVPLIHGPDGAKLSKRHGALGVEAYREMGYLPEALRNYLLRLGWSHGDDEIISTEQAVRWFDLDAVGRAPARFDFAKLDNLNGHYIRAADDDRLVALVAERLEQTLGRTLERHPPRAPAARHAGIEAARRRRSPNSPPMPRFLVAPRPILPDDEGAKLLDSGGTARCSRPWLGVLDRAEWRADALERCVRDFADAKGVKLGTVAQPLRAALTGSPASPGIFEVMEVLGRDETLGRIADAVERS